MSDLIDRQVAIDKLQKEINKGTPPFDDVMGAIRCGVRLARNIIEDLPSADPHWIPCSERLPKYPYRVQIQLDNGWIITGYYSEEHWYTVPHCGGFLRNDEVEAWRELPELYGGEENG